MRKKEVDKTAIFQPIRGAAEISGLSQKYIRAGCKQGRIPHIICGSADVRINMPAFLAMLETESRVNTSA